MYKGDNKSYERSVLYKYIYLALCLDFMHSHVLSMALTIPIPWF